ncbi:DUF6804 family protein [Agrococcus sp. ARC_14]|uniref:DUF6804 family protein n=1 Tax=Agrococcus sp. ARC_14 TaxID=2919927 RepID=UPI001F059BF7|nr:DUF6804 family protein [Agrococcus sp. ARC_14]MCH1883889.1 hypothetical protein [Agrococcus sp. ARC_14]
MDQNRYGPSFQRNALAPGILAALALLVSQAWLAGAWDDILRYVVAILALIVAWFAIQAKHWWWVPVFAVIAVAWNPVVPFELEGPLWIGAHYLVALAFLAAGLLVKTPRQD